MKKLKPVISVRELPPCRSSLRQHLPSIRDLIGGAPNEQEQQLIQYLLQGVICGVYFDTGLLYDVLQPGRKIEDLETQANGLLTDGDWIWPAALVYYLREYHVPLDTDFVKHARDNEWKIDSSRIDPKTLSTLGFDEIDELEHSLDPSESGAI